MIDFAYEPTGKTKEKTSKPPASKKSAKPTQVASKTAPEKSAPVRKTPTDYTAVFVARQPVFDAEGSIWGYELLYRAGNTATNTGQDENIATSQVITDGLSLAMNTIPKSSRVLINFPKQLLLDESALTLPKESCIVEILEDVEATPEVVQAVKALKQAGYTIALDDYIGQKELEPFLPLADILKVDMLDMSFPDIIKISQRLKKLDCKLLAEKVEDRDTYDLAKALGYSYFQGFHFAKPEIVEGRKLKSNALTQLKLLRELADPEYKVKQVARTISLDIGLSHRLLSYMSAVTRDQEIKSLPHAVTILGAKPLKQWLMIVMISDITEGDRANELIYQAARRGRFMELISNRIRSVRIDRDSLFLLGLFSNLDALLNQPMNDVVEHLPLEKEIAEALCGADNPLRGFVILLEAMESGDWGPAEARLEEYSIPMDVAADAFTEAGTWSHGILTGAKTKD